jgi:glycerophosphoryl diester phosphodiesterase
MHIIAHRGASGYAPENTKAALIKAIEQGADMIEFDVHVLPSGEVILMHDHRVNRTTDGLGYVLHQTFEALRLLDAGENEQVPTLDEALDCINRRVRVDIELKGPRSAKAVAAIIRRRLEQDWEAADFLVSSFNHHELQEFKQLMPQIDIVALQDSIPLDYAAFGEELGVVFVAPSDEFVNETYVADAHRRGIGVYVWTVNDPEEVERLYHMGVDGIFTDYPKIAQQTVVALSRSGVGKLKAGSSI